MKADYIFIPYCKKREKPGSEHLKPSHRDTLSHRDTYISQNILHSQIYLFICTVELVYGTFLAIIYWFSIFLRNVFIW